MALAKGARQRGAKVLEHVRVLDVLTADGRVTGVRTDVGDIEAEIVVNCAGQWAKAIGALAGVNVPLYSAEHFYVVTETIAGVHPDLRSCVILTATPISRRRSAGWSSVGSSRKPSRGWAPDKIPYPFEFQCSTEDWEHFEILMDNALLRIPALEHTGLKKLYNGPESFTPDNQFILGEAPECANFFVGAGFNSVGIASAGGAGRALAEWIVNGSPTTDLTGVDIRRFAPFNGNVTGLHDRVAEILGVHYEIPWPNRELATARPFRRSRCIICSRRQGPTSAAGWAGSGRTSSHPRAASLSSNTPGVSRNWLPWSAAEQVSTRTASPSSIRHRSPNTCSPGREQRRPCSGCAPPMWLCRWASRCTPGCSTNAAPTSPTSHRHPHRAA